MRWSVHGSPFFPILFSPAAQYCTNSIPLQNNPRGNNPNITLNATINAMRKAPKVPRHDAVWNIVSSVGLYLLYQGLSPN